ncbi:hypothetical protein [Streptococcus suis]|nr:hypothetical protein [Streptococcus suis]
MSVIRIVRKKKFVRAMEDMYVETSMGSYALRNGDYIDVPTDLGFTLKVSQQPMSFWSSKANIARGQSGEVVISAGFFGPS